MSETRQEERLHQAELLLGHHFARPDLLREALTHRSAAGGRLPGRGRRSRSSGAGSNERLEFIGDRVLGLVMAEWVAERFPNEQEGQLGLRMAYLVSRDAVGEVAQAIGLTTVLSVGANEAVAGVARLTTVIADALEAAIGALYLDGGLDTSRRFIRESWNGMMQAQILPPKDPKTALQERVGVNGGQTPEYRIVSTEGPSHAPHFVIAVSARGQTGTGSGNTKRAAERLAATELLEKLTLLGKIK